MHLRDFSLPTRLLRGAVATLMLAVMAPLAHAQALDTPTLTRTGGGFFRIDFDVQAGASGAPQGFLIQWMSKSDYEDYGFGVIGSDVYSEYCEFEGAPTLNTDLRSDSFLLGQNGAIGIQMGDLFDETGVYGTYVDAVHPGSYAFRVWALGDGVNPSSGSVPSEVQFFSTTGSPECTQGFWKTHPEAWPAGCTPMLLGTVAYTAAELLAIYNTPAMGNGLISMAHQLITVKLNACNGSNIANIAATVAAADALIGNLVIPPVGAGFLAPGVTSPLTNAMDNYNNGIIPGVVACVTPSKKSTWGSVKALYR